MSVFDVDNFVAACVEALDEGPHGSSTVAEVLEEVVSTPSALESALGTPSSNPLMSTWYHAPELTVLHVVWPPDVDLFAHDHQMWAVIGLYGGREDNRFFRRLDDDRITPSGGTTIGTGDVLALGREAVHSVANPSREWTGAIHVYGGDYFATPRTMWTGPSFRPMRFDPDVGLQVLEDARNRASTPTHHEPSRS